MELRVWSVVSTKSMQSPLPQQSWACDHPTKIPQNTTASHHPPQARKFPRAASETLWCRSWVTAHQQTFPGPLQVVHQLQKGFYSLWGGASSPAVKSALGDVTRVVRGDRDPARHQGSTQAWIPPDKRGPRLGPLREGLTLKILCPPVDHMCVRLHIGTTMAPVPPAPVPKPHNSVLPCMSLGLLSCCPCTTDKVSAHK